MRLGLQVPNFTWPTGQSQLGHTFGQIAERADQAGLYSMWVMDHFFQIRNVGPSENEMLPIWTYLSFLPFQWNFVYSVLYTKRNKILLQFERKQ